MAERYLPTTEEIKREATQLGGWRPEVFDDWLASHDAEVRAQALRDAQSDLKDERDDLAATIERVRGMAEAWATQPTDYDEDTEQQIEDGKAIVRALDGGDPA